MKTAKKARAPWLLPLTEWSLAATAFGLSYLAASLALDSGSLVEYAAALVLFGLGIRHVIRSFREVRHRDEHNNG